MGEFFYSPTSIQPISNGFGDTMKLAKACPLCGGTSWCGRPCRWRPEGRSGVYPRYFGTPSFLRPGEQEAMERHNARASRDGAGNHGGETVTSREKSRESADLDSGASRGVTENVTNVTESVTERDGPLSEAERSRRYRARLRERS